MSLTPLTFTGVSKYSDDFQTIIKRAVDIASLPVKALQNQQKDIIQQKLLVSNLSTSVDALRSAVGSLATVGEQRALVASSSNSSKVSASSVNANSPANYNIRNITSLASIASEASLSGYADGTSATVSSTGRVRLVVGSNTYNLDISAAGKNNLAGLRDAINAQNAGVFATVLTTGTGPTPFYLSISANTAGATTLQLRDDPTGANTNLITNNNQGSNTNFQINGVPVSKTSSSISDVIPGVTLNILGTTTGAETVNVSVASDRSRISNALQQLIGAYNSVVDQTDAQIGSSAGLLSGDSLIRTVKDALRSLSGYTGTGSIQSLSTLGISLDKAGKMSFDPTVFNSLSDSQIPAVLDFLGTSTTGLGKIAQTLSSISDPITGIAKVQEDQYDQTNDRISKQVSDATDRITVMQNSLTSRLQAADALLSQLDSQQTVLTASIQSLNFALFGKSQNSN